MQHKLSLSFRLREVISEAWTFVIYHCHEKFLNELVDDIRKQVLILERINIIKHTEAAPGSSLFTDISWQLFPPAYLTCHVFFHR